jgi:hypothetical protein
VILRLLWLRKEDPVINWKEGTLDWKQHELEKIKEEHLHNRHNIQGAKLARKEVTKKELVPRSLHKYLKLFSKKTAERFPPR